MGGQSFRFEGQSNFIMAGRCHLAEAMGEPEGKQHTSPGPHGHPWIALFDARHGLSGGECASGHHFHGQSAPTARPTDVLA